MKFLTDILFCQATSDHYAIGLKILNQLVSEMNQVSILLAWKFVSNVAGKFYSAKEGLK